MSSATARLNERFFAEGLHGAMCLLATGAHTDSGVECLERWRKGQRVTTDITKQKHRAF